MHSRKERSEHSARELFLERAAAYFDDMTAHTKNVPTAQAFDHAEAFALQHGRELIRQSLATLLQEQIDDYEKKKKQHSVRNAKRQNGIAAIPPKKK